MIRLYKQSDKESIIEIYNQAILSKFETADTEIVTVDGRFNWFKSHKPDEYPIYVYEKNNKTVGWLSFSPYRNGRKALRQTAEISYYIHKDYKRCGIGSQLIEFALNHAQKLQFENLFAIILDKNQASINLLKKYNFQLWGHLPNIANFNGEKCGHVYYGRKVQ